MVVINALGSPVLAAELIAEVAKVTPQPVTHVIVMHYHANRIYGLQKFKARGAKNIAQRRALEFSTRIPSARGWKCRAGIARPG